MPWVNGVYPRGYASWSTDASNTLPISAAKFDTEDNKFDTEDNDFAGGPNNCLTKDGLSIPNAPSVWTLSAARPLALLRGPDGVVFSVCRTNGSNNPYLSFGVTDSTGPAIDCSTHHPLSIVINGVQVASFNVTGGITLVGSASNAAYGATIIAGIVKQTAASRPWDCPALQVPAYNVNNVFVGRTRAGR